MPESTTLNFKTWKPCDTLNPGHYCCSEMEMDFVRQSWLEQGVLGRVSLKDERQIKSLTHVFTKAEAQNGTCVVHALPEHPYEISRWLEKLDMGIAYKWQGLARATYQVFLALCRLQFGRRFLGRQLFWSSSTTDALCAGTSWRAQNSTTSSDVAREERRTRAAISNVVRPAMRRRPRKSRDRWSLSFVLSKIKAFDLKSQENQQMIFADVFDSRRTDDLCPICRFACQTCN